MMSFRLVCAIVLSVCAPSAPCQDIPKEMRAKVDAMIGQAYLTAAKDFPCRVKTRGKADMLRWEVVDRCLNEAAARVDWETLSKQLRELKSSVYGISDNDFVSAVESSLSAHALSYEKVFAVKSAEARLPLTNSVLKFLPADSLQDLPVFDKAGIQVGTFAGVFSHERGGGLSTSNMYRLSYFQYTDKNGNMQSASESLLLDSYGVSWKQAMSQPGYRLMSDKLFSPGR